MTPLHWKQCPPFFGSQSFLLHAAFPFHPKWSSSLQQPASPTAAHKWSIQRLWADPHLQWTWRCTWRCLWGPGVIGSAVLQQSCQGLFLSSTVSPVTTRKVVQAIILPMTHWNMPDVPTIVLTRSGGQILWLYLMPATHGKQNTKISSENRASP